MMVGGSGRVDSYDDSVSSKDGNGNAMLMEDSSIHSKKSDLSTAQCNCSCICHEQNKKGMMMMNEYEKVHKVGIPESKSMGYQLNAKVRETFFPDDPFRQFRGQPVGRRMWLAILYLFPILEWAPTYNFNLFKSDLISGLTIASLAIPQGISYAKLASLPPIVGLYSSFVPPLIYVLLGSSRDLAVGPVSIASLLLGALLRAEVSPATEPLLYLQLAFTSTFFAGVFQASLGILRLGFIIDFLSRATLVGFMAGAAVIVSLQQLKGLLGMQDFTSKMDFISVMTSVFQYRKEWAWQTIVMGLFFLGLMLGARFVSKKKPKLFWISAAAPLASVIMATLFTFAAKANNHGISVIGDLQKGLNPPSISMLHFSGKYLMLTIKAGILTGLISLTEGIAVGRTFASIKDYQVDGNKEMMAIGLMNMAGSCTSCYVTTGSFSRSAVNYNAGSRTAVSNVVMSVAVMITLLLLTPLFYYTPVVVLASIIVAAVLGLIDIPAAYFLWKVDKVDFVACLGAFFGVIFISVQIGLVIAVGISVFKILLHVTRPHTYILGNIPGTNYFRNMEQYEEALRIPSFLIIKIEAPIYFANSTYLRERILRWVTDEEERIEKEKDHLLQSVILDLSAVTTIDTTGVNILVEVKKTLQKRHLQLALANPGAGVMEKLKRASLIENLGEDCMYLTVGEAVQSCSRKLQTEV